MIPVWYCLIAFLLGAGLAALLTYYILLARRGGPFPDELLRAREAAVREKTMNEAHERLFAEIRPEIQYFLSTQKHFFARRTRLVIRERLLYRQVPLMGWIEHSHVVEEHLDTAQLEEFAKATARLIEAGNGSQAVIRRL